MPRESAVVPPTVVNPPPAMTVVPSGETCRAFTRSSATSGFQGRSAPSEARKAASLLRVSPLAVEKMPPT